MKNNIRRIIGGICVGVMALMLCPADMVSQNAKDIESIAGYKIALQNCSVNTSGGAMTMSCAGSIDLSPVFGAGAIIKVDKFVFDSNGNVAMKTSAPTAVKFGNYYAVTVPGDIDYKADSANKSFPVSIKITFPVGGKDMTVDAKLSLAAGGVLDTNIALNPPGGQSFLHKEKSGTVETTYISGNLQVKNRAIGNLELKKETRDLGICGDGNVVSPEEQCDDGANNTDKACVAAYGSSCKYCTTACKPMTVKGAYCGDGIITDDVNGDGKVDFDEPEECDDGNTNDKDGCSSKCASNSCDNARSINMTGAVQTLTTTISSPSDSDYYQYDYETNKVVTIKIKTQSHIFVEMLNYSSRCIDGFLHSAASGYADQAGGLALTVKNINKPAHFILKVGSISKDSDKDRFFYTMEYSIADTKCGNGTLDSDEECDDGANNDKVCSTDYNSSCKYCDRACRKRTVKGPYCGDKETNGTEECDDGNAINYDGCSTECKKQENCRGIINDYSTMESRNAGAVKCAANSKCVNHEGNCIGKAELTCKMIRSKLKCTSFDNKCKWDFGLDMCVDGKSVCEEIKPASVNYSNQTNCELVAGCGLFMSGIEKNTVGSAKCVTCASITKKEECVKNPRDGYQYGCGWNTNTQKCEACSKVDMEMTNQQNSCNALDGCGWLLGENSCKSCTVIGFKGDDRATANCIDAPNCTYVQPYHDAYVNNKNNLGCQPKSTIK